MIDNVEQEIWLDFKHLSERGDLDRYAKGMAKEHLGIAYSENDSLIYQGAVKKLENDEDFKINKFLYDNQNVENIDWSELEKLYPKRNLIQLTNKEQDYPMVKFRTHKERREIDIILLDEWNGKKEKLHSKIPTETAAKEYLIDIRWDNKPVCPKCGNTKIYILTVYNSFKCSKCGIKFSEKVGTIFQGSKLSLLKWYEAMYLLTAIKTRKISTHQLAHTLDLTQKTAWGMAHKIQSKVNDEFIKNIKKNLFK